MRLSDVYCRECGSNFSLPDGCEVCNPARKALVVPDEISDFGRTGPGALLNQNLRILNTVAARLENEMRQGMHPKDSKSTDWRKHRYDRDHARDAMALAKSVAALADAARKYEKQQADEVAGMSLEQKMELVVQMLEDFPVELQEQACIRIRALLESPVEAEFE